MSAHAILTFMFHVVEKNMYRSEWKPLTDEAVQDGDISEEQTIVEATL